MGKLILYIIGAFFTITIVGTLISSVDEAASVAKKEFGAKASLTKYEWFKDASEQITKLGKDITIYENKVTTHCTSTTDRIAREQCMTWSQEVAGIKSARNDVVAEYNAQSRKFNWSMYNADNIPVSYGE